VEQLRGFLALDKIKAIAVAQNGNVFPVESSVWRAENGRQLFDTGLLPVGNLRDILPARNNRSHLRQILVPEDELIALLEDIPTVSKRKRRRRIEADEDLEHRIREVIRFTEERWPDPYDRPSCKQMAKELEDRYGYMLRFKAPTIDKILRGTYRPAQRRNLKGLR